MRQYQRIPCSFLLLVAAVFALSSSMFASAFVPAMPMSNSGRIILRAEGETNGSTATDGPQQKDFGQTLELPDTYASCGQCGANYALTLEAMGPGKGGRYVNCFATKSTQQYNFKRGNGLGLEMN